MWLLNTTPNLAQALPAFLQTFKKRQRDSLLALLRSFERLIAQQSLVGDACFFDTDDFEWIAEIEANWTQVREELEGLLKRIEHLPNFQDISTDQSDLTHDDLWKTYFLYAYGYKADQSCASCPETTRLIESIPGMKTAFFSILLPHKEIGEHRGPYKGFLRYHLALKVPTEDAQQCGIRVGPETAPWVEGKSLVFDDTFYHAAWNRTDQVRVILFLDFIRPMRFPFSLLNRAIIQLIAWSPYIQRGKENFLNWERQFKALMDRETIEEKV